MQGAVHLQACYSRLFVCVDNQGGYGIGAVSLVYNFAPQAEVYFFFILYMYRIVYTLPLLFSLDSIFPIEPYLKVEKATKQKVVAQKSYVHIQNLKCVSLYKYVTQHLFLLVYLDHQTIYYIYCFYLYYLVTL
jgi:hypothetical protein